MMMIIISTKKPDLVIVSKKKKRTWRIVNFGIPVDHRVKLKKSKKRDEFLDLARGLDKTLEHESNCNWCAQCSQQRISPGTGGFGNNWMSGDHSNYSIVEISQNAKKSLGGLRRLAVTQSPEKTISLPWNEKLSKE